MQTGGGHEPVGQRSAAVHRQVFLKTREIVGRFGDIDATYAVFMSRPVVFTPRLAVDWLQETAAVRGSRFTIDSAYQEGDWVGAGEPLMYISGSLKHLVDLEIVFLQKLGPPSSPRSTPS